MRVMLPSTEVMLSDCYEHAMLISRRANPPDVSLYATNAQTRSSNNCQDPMLTFTRFLDILDTIQILPPYSIANTRCTLKRFLDT